MKEEHLLSNPGGTLYANPVVDRNAKIVDIVMMEKF